MARPNEFVDLMTTSVKVQRDLLERAKKADINISKVLREALAAKVGEAPKKAASKLRKFKGLPRHIVTKAKDNIIENMKNVPETVDWLNSEYGINCNAADLDALVPRF